MTANAINTISLDKHLTTGRIGEEHAVQLMSKKGYKIIATNWHMGHLEIDVICGNRKEIVFIEVKTRTSTFGDKQPEEFVDSVKQRRIIAAANAYIKLNHENRTPRFDVIGVLIKGSEIVETTHIEDAFHPHAKTINTNSYSGEWRWKHKGKIIKGK